MITNDKRKIDYTSKIQNLIKNFGEITEFINFVKNIERDLRSSFPEVNVTILFSM